MKIMELFENICYTICLKLYIPPLMDWASHRMTIEIELIFYTCLILIIINYFERFMLWIYPSINATKILLAPTAILVIITHRFDLEHKPSTKEDKMPSLILTNLTMCYILTSSIALTHLPSSHYLLFYPHSITRIPHLCASLSELRPLARMSSPALQPLQGR
ncbi:hypothetical protein QL285_000446 [Trifolium repens]|nr:hypothetical protein QL285_000446 [Trifolium repens]